MKKIYIGQKFGVYNTKLQTFKDFHIKSLSNNIGKIVNHISDCVVSNNYKHDYYRKEIFFIEFIQDNNPLESEDKTKGKYILRDKNNNIQDNVEVCPIYKLSPESKKFRQYIKHNLPDTGYVYKCFQGDYISPKDLIGYIIRKFNFSSNIYSILESENINEVESFFLNGSLYGSLCISLLAKLVNVCTKLERQTLKGLIKNMHFYISNEFVKHYSNPRLLKMLFHTQNFFDVVNRIFHVIPIYPHYHNNESFDSSNGLKYKNHSTFINIISKYLYQDENHNTFIIYKDQKIFLTRTNNVLEQIFFTWCDKVILQQITTKFCFNKKNDIFSSKSIWDDQRRALDDFFDKFNILETSSVRYEIVVAIKCKVNYNLLFMSDDMLENISLFYRDKRYKDELMQNIYLIFFRNDSSLLQYFFELGELPTLINELIKLKSNEKFHYISNIQWKCYQWMHINFPSQFKKEIEELALKIFNNNYSPNKFKFNQFKWCYKNFIHTLSFQMEFSFLSKVSYLSFENILWCIERFHDKKSLVYYFTRQKYESVEKEMKFLHHKKILTLQLANKIINTIEINTELLDIFINIFRNEGKLFITKNVKDKLPYEGLKQYSRHYHLINDESLLEVKQKSTIISGQNSYLYNYFILELQCSYPVVHAILENVDRKPVMYI